MGPTLAIEVLEMENGMVESETEGNGGEIFV